MISTVGINSKADMDSVAIMTDLGNSQCNGTKQGVNQGHKLFPNSNTGYSSMLPRSTISKFLGVFQLFFLKCFCMQ